MIIRKLALTNFVRDVRRSRGLSQAQLADLIGCSVNALSSIENGASCSIRVALKLSVALRCPVPVLFCLVDLPSGSYIQWDNFDHFVCSEVGGDSLEV